MSVLLVIAFLVGNFYKFSIFSADVHISVLDLVVIAINLWALVHKKLKLNQALGLFLLVGLISLIPAYFHFGAAAAIVGSMYLVRFALYANLIWLMKPTKNLILVLGVTLVITGAVQCLLFPDIRSLQIAEWDPHYYRVVGTLLDPGFMGIILVLFLIFLTEFKQSIYQVLWGITYVVMMLTYSRSSYLAFLAAMAWVAWKRKSLKYFLFILLLFTVTVTILPRSSSGEGVKLERTNSIHARIDNWQNALTIFAKHPVIGVGFNTYRYAQKEYGYLTDSKWLSSHAGAGADSSLLFVAATTGIVGLAAYLFYFSRLWKNTYLRPFLLALLVHSLFLNSLFYPFVLVFLAVIAGYKSPSALSESDSRHYQSQ